MKRFTKLFFLLFFSFIFFKTQAQQKHFIYIESEDRQAFAVVLNGKVYSSSDYGYVIVPKLEDGNYNFTVSFPLNKYTDQKFKCVINKKDLGYKLTNTAGKAWALQNMQTQKVLGGSGTVAAADNAFTDMLSDVVNDSNLSNKSLPVANKPDTIAAALNVDTSTVFVTTNTSNNKIGLATDSLTQPQKIFETKQDTGTNMVFVDKTLGADTINVFVPSGNSSNNVTQNSISNNDAATTLTDTSTHTAGNPFYKSTDENANNNSSITINADTTASTQNLSTKTTSAVKEDCSKMISDDDVDKLKRKMFVQNNDNGMIQAALKYLNNKCLTTNQVKTLGNIFSSDDGRYNLYDALYKNVYDYGNYVNLESQIVDPYYKRRFETMLR